MTMWLIKDKWIKFQVPAGDRNMSLDDKRVAHVDFSFIRRTEMMKAPLGSLPGTRNPLSYLIQKMKNIAKQRRPTPEELSSNDSSIGSLSFSNGKISFYNIESSSTGQQELKVRLEGDFLQEILTRNFLTEQKSVRVKIIIAAPFSSFAREKYVKDGVYKKLEICVLDSMVYCEGTIKIPESWKLSWLEQPPTDKRINYTAKLGVKLSFEQLQISLESRRRINGQVETDMEIVPGIANVGVPIKCNKAFLMAQSKVIRCMMESDFLEGQTNQIHMDDMSEKGIRALLSFLSSRDMSVPICDVYTAVELLKCGHKYQIRALESAMKTILMIKPIDIFEMGAALLLFFFVNKVANLYDLRLQSIKILNAKYNELISSDSFKQILTNNDLQAAKELFDALIMYRKLTAT